MPTEGADVDVATWKKMRRRMLMIFNGGGSIIGLVLTGYFPTMYEYIEQITGGHRTSFYYSVVVGCGMMAAVFSSFVASAYYDFTLNVKAASIVGLLLCALGNLLYLVSYSIYFPMVGYSFVLCIAATTTASISEIIHICDKERLTPIIGMLMAFKVLGMLLGPSLVFAYNKVDIVWKGWRLNSGNMPALIMGTICLVYTVVACTAWNMAKMQHLKTKKESKHENGIVVINNVIQRCNVGFEEEIGVSVEPQSAARSYGKIEMDGHLQMTEGIEYNSSNASKGTSHPVNIVTTDSISTGTNLEGEQAIDDTADILNISLRGYLLTAIKVLRSRNYLVIWLSTVVPTFTQYLALHLFTVIANEKLGWHVDDISFIRLTTLGGGFVTTFLVIVLSKYCEDVHMTILQNVLTMFPVAFMLVVVHIEGSLARGALVYTAAVVVGSTDSSCDVLSVSMMGKIVNSRHQAIGEMLRLIGFYIALALSGFCTDTVFHNMDVGCSVVIVLNVFILGALIYDRKRYLNSPLH